MKAIDTGAGIVVPVGNETLGRVFNVLGEPVDDLGPVNTKVVPSTARRRRSTNSPPDEMFETGIKVIDLLEPFLRAARSGSSAAPASARPSSSRSSSTTSPASTAASRCSPASASEPAKATICGSKCRNPA